MQDIVYIDKSLLNFIDLETTNGIAVEKIMNKKNDIPIVIGYNYRKVLSV